MTQRPAVEQVVVPEGYRVTIEGENNDGRPATLDEADARARGAAAKGKAATGALLPSLALRASARYANPDPTQFPIRAEWGSYWDASLVLTWTLDAGVTWNQARGARLDAHAARAAADALARQAEVDLAQAHASLDLAPSRLELAGERVRLAEQALSTARTTLDAGRARPIDVAEREADLALARAAHLKVALDIVVEVETARTLAGHHGPHPPMDGPR